MAEPIVDIFEVININHQATDGCLIMYRLAHLGAQSVFQMMAIAQTGQRVVECFFQ
ncbi:hypothetical protein D3C73_1382710 [compost metagenome]